MWKGESLPKPMNERRFVEDNSKYYIWLEKYHFPCLSGEVARQRQGNDDNGHREAIERAHGSRPYGRPDPQPHPD